MMSKKALIFILFFINVFMVMLLVDKQNRTIKALLQLQRFEEKRDQLLEKQKALMLLVEHAGQLEVIKQHAVSELGMQPIELKDLKKIPELILEDVSKQVPKI